MCWNHAMTTWASGDRQGGRCHTRAVHHASAMRNRMLGRGRILKWRACSQAESLCWCFMSCVKDALRPLQAPKHPKNWTHDVKSNVHIKNKQACEVDLVGCIFWCSIITQLIPDQATNNINMCTRSRNQICAASMGMALTGECINKIQMLSWLLVPTLVSNEVRQLIKNTHLPKGMHAATNDKLAVLGSIWLYVWRLASANACCYLSYAGTWSTLH